MKKLLLSFILLASIGLVSACTDTPELKSPCVGANGSPCDWRKPVNNA